MAALCVGVAWNALILNCCISYFGLLQGVGAYLSGLIDHRGGLYEIHGPIPFLALLSGASSLAASRWQRLKAAGACSFALSLLLWACAATLAHFIRTSLR